MNDNSNQFDNNGASKQDGGTCAPGCSCHAAGPPNRMRWMAGVIILVAAGALAVRAIVKSNGLQPDPAPPEFSALPVASQLAEPVAAAGSTSAAVAVKKEELAAIKEIGSLSDLNVVAADTSGVFVFLPGIDEPPIKTPLAQIRGAVQTIESQARIKMGLFMLKPDSPDYAQIAAQIPTPAVLAMVKGRGMFPVSGEITESKLIQGFVAASSAGGCCAGSCR